jgi:hypothetical protein
MGDRPKDVSSILAPGDIFRIGNLSFLLLRADECGHLLAAVLPAKLAILKRQTGDLESGEHLVRIRSARLVKVPLLGAVVTDRLTEKELLQCIRQASAVPRKRKNKGSVFVIGEDEP